MIGKLLKSIFKLGFYAGGLGAVVAVWDYTQQAKAADYQYSYEEYKLSVMDRYGEEAVFALSTLESAKSGLKTGAQAGLKLAEDSGLLEKIGIALPETVFEDDTQPVEIVIGPDGEMVIAPVELAVATQALAPETSLFPRARVLR